ncbi:MAG: hypothetical protein JNK56_13625, partial [Myxococcales bacterium]|nr:hypothetical protein [Myxococcales bacterium]
MRTVLVALGLLAGMPVLALTGCDAEEDGAPSGAVCPEDSLLTWDNFAKP